MKFSCFHGRLSHAIFYRLLVLAALIGFGRAPAACLAQAEIPSAASWLWYPERPNVEGVNQTRYFHHVFDLSAAASHASLRIMADDSCQVWVNGQRVSPTDFRRGSGAYDVGKLLVPGRNALAIAVHNAAGMAGLLLLGEVREPDGKVITLTSNASFRAAREVPENWTARDFDASSWVHAQVLGSVFMKPWYLHPLFDVTPFITPADQAMYDKWIESKIGLPRGLAAEAKPTIRLGLEHGRAVLRIGDKAMAPFFYSGRIDPMTEHGARQIRNFRDAGVHLYTLYVAVENVWTGPTDFNITQLDRTIRGYLHNDPEAHIFILVDLRAPKWWMDAHPRSLIQYALPAGAQPQGRRPRMASMASQPWHQAMLTELTAIVNAVESQPYAARIIGFSPCYGVSSEWHYFGGWSGQMPDTSPPMTDHFRRWLKEKYQTDAALRTAWHQSDASFAKAQVPDMNARRAEDLLVFRDPRKRQAVIDYYHCQQEIVATLIDEFCGRIKSITDRRLLAGVYYGYFHDVIRQAQGGHLALSRVLASPNVDWLFAPYDYYHRLAGDDGRPRDLPMALAGKVHMIEDDTRTYLHDRNENGRIDTQKGTIAVLRRNFAQALTNGCGLWWTDFGNKENGGWYDDPALMKEIASFVKLARQTLQRPRHSVAQIAVIADLESCYGVGDNDRALTIPFDMIDRTASQLYRSGAPFDTLLLSQLEKADLSQYRLLIFINATTVTPAQRLIIRRSTQGKSVLWLWAPGINDGKSLDLTHIRQLTGFAVKAGSQTQCAKLTAANDSTLLKPGTTYDALVPTDQWLAISPSKTQTAVAWAAGSKAVVIASEVSAGREQVLCSLPGAPRELLEAMMARAGVDRYTTDPNVVLMMDSDMVALHTQKNANCTLKMTGPTRLKDVVTGEAIGPAESFPLRMDGPQTRMFLIQSQNTRGGSGKSPAAG